MRHETYLISDRDAERRVAYCRHCSWEDDSLRAAERAAEHENGYTPPSSDPEQASLFTQEIS
jgi:hypothetical protein